MIDSPPAAPRQGKLFPLFLDMMHDVCFGRYLVFHFVTAPFGDSTYENIIKSDKKQ